MIFNFEPGDFKNTVLLESLQYSTLDETVNHMYDHVQAKMGQTIYLVYVKNWERLFLEHSFQLADVFWQEHNTILVFFNEENAKKFINERIGQYEKINFIFILNGVIQELFQIELTQTPNTIQYFNLFQLALSKEIPQDEMVSNYQLYDCNQNLISEDKDVALNLILEKPQPFYLNLVTIQKPQNILVTVFMNGVQVHEIQQDSNQEIFDSVQQILISPDQIVQSYTLYDSNGIQLIDENTNAQFSNFKENSQPLILNIITESQQQINQDSLPLLIQSSSNDETIDLMKQMLPLHKLQLFIDKNGEFIIYTFHKPILVKGFLRKDKSTPKPQFRKEKYKWILFQSVKVAEIGDYSFAVEWDNGNISKIELEQI